MKKIATLVLALILILGIASVASAEAHTIALCNINEKGVFGKLVKKGFEDACAERGWNLVYFDNNADGQTAVSNASALALRDDIEFCVNMVVDASVGQSVMDILTEAGIPVLAVDISLPGAPFFGIDSGKMGTYNGEWVAEWTKENWEGKMDYCVLITQIASGDEVNLRVRNSPVAIEAAGVEIGEVVEIEGQNDTAIVQQRFTDFLTAHPDAGKIFVFTINENAGSGVYAAAVTAGRDQDVRVMTSNCGSPFVDAMYAVEGDTTFFAACANYPERYGAQVCDLIQTALEDGVTLEGVYPCNMTIVTWDNIEEEYPRDNLPWKDLI